MRFFHRYDTGADPAELLKPENQVSTPWGPNDRGPCDKCLGCREVEHRCRSCLERDPDPACPACDGRVRYLDGCPACDRSGEITDVERRGVSSFPTIEGLYRYLVEHGDDLSGAVIVEFEGTLSQDRDLDADEGALLGLPSEIVAVHDVDRERVGELRRRVG